MHQNYLGMRDSRQTPSATRFRPTSYSFSIRMRKEADGRVAKRRPFDALKLVWHDYPGEWFEFDPTGEEQQRRVDTFRRLLSSDVAGFLVDGQKLLDNVGEEERYLKKLFSNFRNGFLSLKDDILEDGRVLDDFPRIWILALSKADLWPDLDVVDFRDLVVSKAGQEVTELQEVLSGFVSAPEALSVGEDFLLLSSAEFTPERIDLSKNIGLDLMLPFAAVLPFQRHLAWNRAALFPQQALEKALDSGVVDMAMLFASFAPAVGPLRKIAGLRTVVGFFQRREALDGALGVAQERFREIGEQSRAKRDYLTAAIAGFLGDIERGEKDRVFFRSLRWR